MRRARKPPWVVDDPRVAALTLDHRFQLLERRTRVESPPHHQLRIGVGPETAGHQHPRREPDDQIGELGGARTAQDLDTFLDFNGVADGAPERRVHAGDDRLGSDAERAPVATIDRARARALSRSFMKAPCPHFTSSTSALVPSASFLLMIDEEMSGMLSTVAVTSRNAYSFLSAGASDVVCAMMLVPTARTTSLNCAIDRSTRKPGIDSSLSIVPPVWPRPRPDIFGTTTPLAAASGASAIDTLSPTPPVLCFPTLMPGRSDRSRRSPERSMASVSQAVSSSVIPRRTTAISNADVW